MKRILQAICGYFYHRHGYTTGSNCVRCGMTMLQAIHAGHGSITDSDYDPPIPNK